MSHIHIISGTSNRFLAEDVADILQTSLIDSNLRTFADGEIHCQIGENIRGKDVFIIQPTCAPVNDNLMELLIMADALKRASAKSIVAVMPYFGYARQDRKSNPRTPISAKLVADMLETSGVTRIMTIDLHAGSIQGFFNIPVEDIQAQSLFESDIQKHYSMDDVVVVSPDIGGVVRARHLATELDVPLAIVDKRRPKPNEAEVEHVIGDVSGKVCVLVDDMVDTGGTICKAAAFLKHSCGAKDVCVYASHGVLSGDAVDRIKLSEIKRLVLTDSMPVPVADNIETISCAPLLAEAILNVAKERGSAE